MSGEEGEEIKSPQRKVSRVESEETQDYVREAKDLNQEESGRTEFRTERDQRSAKNLCFGVTIDAAKRPSASGSWRRWW